MSRPIVALALVAALAGACGADLAPSAVPASPSKVADDPTAPVVVTGRFVDRTGIPVPNASVTLEVMAVAHGHIGQAPPMVFSAETRTGLDGSFRFRFVIPADLRLFAKANSDYVNFGLTAMPTTQDPAEMGFSGFSRHLAAAGSAFDDETPTIVLRP